MSEHFRKKGFQIHSVHEKHVLVSATAALFEQQLGCRVTDTGFGFEFTEFAGLPDLVRRRIRFRIAGGATVEFDDLPEELTGPSEQSVQAGCFEVDGTPQYRFGDSFSSHPPPLDRLLFLSDIRSVLGVDYVNAALEEEDVDLVQSLTGLPYSAAAESVVGKGVNVFLVDSGIDVTHPAIKPHYEDGRVLFPAAVEGPLLSKPGEDNFGHGTMCAAMLFAMAPGCTLHFLPAAQSTLGMTSSDVSQAVSCTLVNLLLAVYYACGKKPSVVSLSFGYKHSIDIEQDWSLVQQIAEEHGYETATIAGLTNLPNEQLAVLGDILGLAREHSVQVCVAAGNATYRPVVAFDAEGKKAHIPVVVPLRFINYPGGIRGTLSIGACYPDTLDCPPWKTQGCDFVVSDLSNSGDFEIPPYQKQVLKQDKVRFPTLCGIAGGKNGYVFVPWRLDEPRPEYQLAVKTYAVDSISVGWIIGHGGTSLATPQVAGILALLLEKYPGFPIDPPLWGQGCPEDVVAFLETVCADVCVGNSAVGNEATVGPDTATGVGVPNALRMIGEVDYLLLQKAMRRALEEYGQQYQ